MDVSPEVNQRTWLSETGFGCEVLWGRGNPCGYVALGHEHPWIVRRLTQEQIEDLVYARGGVHGGITYGPDEDTWIGFDTAHSGDVWDPEELRRLGCDEVWVKAARVIGGDGTLPWTRRWTFDDVVKEVERLAHACVIQLQEVPRDGC